MIKHCAFYFEDHEYDAWVYGLGPTEVDSKFTTSQWLSSRRKCCVQCAVTVCGTRNLTSTDPSLPNKEYDYGYFVGLTGTEVMIITNR